MNYGPQLSVLVAHNFNPAIGGQEIGKVISLFEQWFSDRTLANFKLARGIRTELCSLPL